MITCVSAVVDEGPRGDDLVPDGEGEVGEVVLHQRHGRCHRCVDVDGRLPSITPAFGVSLCLRSRSTNGIGS